MESLSFVSIALCTYNGEKFLREQLDSLVSQSYRNLEIIAVDDCSTDQTFVILQEYSVHYPFIKVYQNKTNLGFAKNFEHALSLCSGELIALSDQDDIWHIDKISKQATSIGDNLFIYHDSEFILQDGQSLNKKMSDIVNLYRGANSEAFLFFNCVSGHSILMKQELVEKALPLKEGHFHDWWLAYTATNLGSIDFIPECLIKYRQHENNATDILRVKRENEVRKSLITSDKKIKNQLKWIKSCADFEYNKNPELVLELYKLYKNRITSYFSLKLLMFMFTNMDILFFIQKKSQISKYNYIRKLIWRLKAK
ncbi:MAG: glycosyltransferase family 2 protein [Janthinobacterium lividum]